MRRKIEFITLPDQCLTRTHTCSCIVSVSLLLTLILSLSLLPYPFSPIPFPPCLPLHTVRYTNIKTNLQSTGLIPLHSVHKYTYLEKNNAIKPADKSQVVLLTRGINQLGGFDLKEIICQNKENHGPLYPYSEHPTVLKEWPKTRGGLCQLSSTGTLTIKLNWKRGFRQASKPLASSHIAAPSMCQQQTFFRGWVGGTLQLPGLCAQRNGHFPPRRSWPLIPPYVSPYSLCLGGNILGARKKTEKDGNSNNNQHFQNAYNMLGTVLSTLYIAYLTQAYKEGAIVLPMGGMRRPKLRKVKEGLPLSPWLVSGLDPNWSNSASGPIPSPLHYMTLYSLAILSNNLDNSQGTQL